jgi:hypothetical protein
MFPSPDAFACFPLPSSGYRGRSLQKPCGSPPSPVLWGRNCSPSLRDPSGRPSGSRTSLCRGVPLVVGGDGELFLGSRPISPEACLGLETPATPARPRHSGRCQMLPSAGLTASASQRYKDFGAESSWPAFSLCTLRTRQSPGEWQHSLPACPLRLLPGWTFTS